MSVLLVVSALLFALMLATAQSLWKFSVSKQSIDLTNLASYIHVLLSPPFIIGAILYVLSVLVYLYALAHYDFSKVQALAIPLSLIFSMIAAVVLFHEHIKPINIVGIGIILVGIYFVIAR